MYESEKADRREMLECTNRLLCEQKRRGEIICFRSCCRWGCELSATSCCCCIADWSIVVRDLFRHTTHNSSIQHRSTRFNTTARREKERGERKRIFFWGFISSFISFIFSLCSFALSPASPLRFTHRKSLNRIFHAVRTRQRRCRFPKLFESLWLWHFHHHSFVRLLWKTL